MYWPIGSPRVFVEAQDFPQDQIQVSHEDAGAKRKSSAGEAAAKHGLRRGDGDPRAQQAPQAETSTNGNVKRRPSEASGEKGSLLGARLARNGQLFVTWTASSFSIWQAKVSYHNVSLECY